MELNRPDRMDPIDQQILGLIEATATAKWVSVMVCASQPMPQQTHTLRELIERDHILLAPGVADAMEAKIAVQQGAEAIYISGNSISSSIHGNPDIGLTSFKETLERARTITGAVDVPVICDVDNGYGNALNVIRTVNEFERAKVDGIQIEDQTWPKKCGHLDGKELISTETMCAKIRAAVNTRESDDFIVVARTDAIAADGIGEAIDRAKTYAEHGADLVFVDAPESVAQLERIGDELREVPMLTNIPYGGETPLQSASELEKIGFDVMVFACVAQKAKIKVLEEVFSTLLETGDEREVADRLGDWRDRERVTELDWWTNLEEQYVELERQ